MIKAILTGVPDRSGRVLLRCIADCFLYFDDDGKRTAIILLCSTINAARLHQRSDASLIMGISLEGDLLRNLFISVRCSTLAVHPRQDVLGIIQLITYFMDKVQDSDIPYARNFLKACRRADLFGLLHHILEPGLVRDYTYGKSGQFRHLILHVT